MRSSRGLTRSTLATQAGVADSTIFKVETTGQCTWRAPTAYNILRALESVRPLSPSEAKQFVDGTGLTVEVKTQAPTARDTVQMFGSMSHPAAQLAEKMARARTESEAEQEIHATVGRMASLYTKPLTANLLAIFEQTVNAITTAIATTDTSTIPALKFTMVDGQVRFDMYVPTGAPAAPATKAKGKRQA